MNAYEKVYIGPIVDSYISNLMLKVQGYEILGVNEFSRYLKRKNVVLVDVRTPDEYAEGHIPGTDFNINVLETGFNGWKNAGKNVER